MSMMNMLSMLGGLALFLYGMDMMSTAMKPLAEVEAFVGLLSKFENPILGILAGTVFTALIQSSSASVGILQALAMSGAFDVFAGVNTGKLREIQEREEYVDFLNKEISKYITNVAVFEKTNSASQMFNALFTITSNVERIGDHAINIAEYNKMIQEKKIRFSEQALNISNEILTIAMAENN